MKTNKWSLYQDFDLWEYRFSAILMQERNLTYPDLLKAFITACHTSGVSKLRHRDGENSHENFLKRLNKLVDFIEDLKLKNEYGLYPKISSRDIYNLGEGKYDEYVFDNGLYLYDKDGVIVNREFTFPEMKSVLTEIDHGQADYTGLSLPFEFDTNDERLPDKRILSYNFQMTFYSDIWLDEVPCIHCEEEESVKNDNSELAALNRENMNNFLSQMKQVCADFGGEMIVEQENLRWLYQGKFSTEGFEL